MFWQEDWCLSKLKWMSHLTDLFSLNDPKIWWFFFKCLCMWDVWLYFHSGSNFGISQVSATFSRHPANRDQYTVNVLKLLIPCVHSPVLLPVLIYPGRCFAEDACSFPAFLPCRVYFGASDMFMFTLLLWESCLSFDIPAVILCGSIPKAVIVNINLVWMRPACWRLKVLAKFVLLSSLYTF